MHYACTLILPMHTPSICLPNFSSWPASLASNFMCLKFLVLNRNACSFQDMKAKMPRLKRGAIRSQNLPTSSHEARTTLKQQAQMEARQQRLARRSSSSVPEVEEGTDECLSAWNEDIDAMFMSSTPVHNSGWFCHMFVLYGGDGLSFVP